MIEVIPAIDIINGKCVRLSQGDFSREKIYYDNPLEVAKEFEDAGFKRLHLVDLDGARVGKITNLHILESIADQTDLIIDFGGGIKTDADLNSAFNSGAAFINLGSIAVKDPEIVARWIIKFGADKILLGADVKDEKIVINGWQSVTEIPVYDFLSQYSELGIRNFFCTDITKDGLLQGAAIGLYQKIISRYLEINLIASGGVSCCEEIDSLHETGCKGVFIGKAIYEGNISLSNLKKYLD